MIQNTFENEKLETPFKTPEELREVIGNLQEQLNSIQNDQNLSQEVKDLKKVIANIEIRRNAIQN